MKRALLAALLAGAVPGAFAPVASAAPLGARVTKVGWWSQQPGAGPQAAGGFQVTLAPQGPQSVAALEVALEPASDAHVMLSLTEGPSIASDRATLSACTTPSRAWSAANPGPWSDAPPHDCTRSVRLARDPVTATWRADISGLVGAGTVSALVILPVASPVGGAIDPGYQVTISKAAVTADAPPAAPPAADTVPLSPGPSTTSYGAPGLAATAFGPLAAPLALSAQPPLDGMSVPAPEVVPLPRPGAPSSGNGRRRPWARLLGFVPLAAAIGAGAAALRRHTLPPV